MIDVEIEDEAWAAALPDAEALVERAAVAALNFISAHPDERRDPGFFPEGERAMAQTWTPAAAGVSSFSVTVLLTDDATLHDLNSRFRGQDRPTNVLSFPAPTSARPHLGDVALAFATCEREANEQGKPLSSHLTHLVAHGVLHLVGYDHESEAEAVVMEALEQDVLAGLGLPDPYAPNGNPEDVNGR